MQGKDEPDDLCKGNMSRFLNGCRVIADPEPAKRACRMRSKPEIDVGACRQQLHHVADLDHAEADRALCRGLHIILAAVPDEAVVHERGKKARSRRECFFLL